MHSQKHNTFSIIIKSHKYVLKEVHTWCPFRGTRRARTICTSECSGA